MIAWGLTAAALYAVFMLGLFAGLLIIEWGRRVKRADEYSAGVIDGALAGGRHIISRDTNGPGPDDYDRIMDELVDQLLHHRQEAR